MTLSRGARVAIVGAGVAGLRAAETLRSEGFAGHIEVIGAEPRPPYSRPPLSKSFLTDGLDPAAYTLPGWNAANVTWRLGTAVAAADLSARELLLETGQRVPFDGLVITSGARPRTIAVPAPAHGVFTLRGLDDAVALRRALRARPRRVLVVGAGYIGGEVASSVRALGIPVTLVEAARLPLGAALGEPVGALLARVHREHGVDLRLGSTVASLRARGRGLAGAELSDAGFVAAELCVLALGTEPNVGWLAGSGLELAGGVACHRDLRARGAESVVAAGDVARWPHPAFGGEVLGVGHWSNAAEQGAHAARTLLGHRAAFAEIPTVSSKQHGLGLRAAGVPALGEPAVLEGSVAERRFVMGYWRDERLAGLVAVNLGRRLPALVPRIGLSTAPAAA